jgi:hypothetical protein
VVFEEQNLETVVENNFLYRFGVGGTDRESRYEEASEEKNRARHGHW